MYFTKWNCDSQKENPQVSTVRFVIWGGGIRGNKVVKSLGIRHIAAIIDINKQVGTIYETIPIISLEIYKKEYMECPIIITPKDAERQIIQTLHEEEIYHCISYTDEYMGMESFSYVVHGEEILKNHRYDEHIVIYGYCGVGLLLYEYLSASGFRVSLAADKQNVFWSCKRIDDDEIDSIILVKNVPEDEFQELLYLNKKMDDFRNFMDYRPLFYRENLEIFRDVHRGERCFIVAPGPSLRIDDLITLHKNREICFALNRVILALDKVEWRPDYFVLSDDRRAEELKNDVLKYPEIKHFISDNVWPYEEDNIDGIYKYHLNATSTDENGLPLFSADFSGMVYAGWTVTYATIQLAVYMGFKEIYLLGVDCSYIKGSRNNYFMETKEENFADSVTDAMLKAYQAAKIYADEHDLHIYNATRGGMLEIFKRVDFDGLF